MVGTHGAGAQGEQPHLAIQGALVTGGGRKKEDCEGTRGPHPVLRRQEVEARWAHVRLAWVGCALVLLRLVCAFALYSIVKYCNIVGAVVVAVLGTALLGTLMFGDDFLGQIEVLHSLGDNM